MGRHASSTRRRARTPFLIAGTVIVLAAGILIMVNLPHGSGECQPTLVKVVAAPEIAPVVNEIGRTVTSSGSCYQFQVDDRDPGAVEEALVVSDSPNRPDVWIPDSSLRLRRTHSPSAEDVPESGPSIADSPVVLTVTEQAATRLGWPSRNPTWWDVVADASITLGIPDPTTNPVGLAALMGVRQALSAAGVSHPDTGYPAALRRFAANTLPAVDDLYSRLPSAGSSKQPVNAFPASENSVLRHNLRESTAPIRDSLVAVYPPKPIPALDYPFAVLASTGEEQYAGAQALLRALLAPSGQSALANAGFRTPDGQSLLNRTQDEHVSVVTQTLADMPSDAVVSALLAQWARANETDDATGSG